MPYHMTSPIRRSLSGLTLIGSVIHIASLHHIAMLKIDRHEKLLSYFPKEKNDPTIHVKALVTFFLHF